MSPLGKQLGVDIILISSPLAFALVVPFQAPIPVLPCSMSV